MAYCTTPDVQIYLTNFTFDANSSPSLAQVDQMCIDVSDNVIDPVVSRYLTLPVTNPVGLKYLQQWAVACVLASVYRSIETNAELASIYDDQCQAFKEGFMNDPGLVDVPFTNPDRAQSKGSVRPVNNWHRNEVEW